MSKDLVLQANAAFYEAFRRRDVSTLTGLWAWEHPVTCVHPGWDLLEGRDRVIASWLAILSNPDSPQITCGDAVAHVTGDVAYVTCHELIGDAVLTATNIFIREEGTWRLTHHHASPTATIKRAPKKDPKAPSSLN